jgi:hypothetical protein
MRYAKLINSFPTYAPNPILVDGNWIGNPPGEVYLAEGYKPVVYADDPGEAPVGYRWEETWAEEDGNIQQGWVLVETPISEEEALVRYANELTGAEDETLTEATETLIKQLKEGN